LSCKDVCSVICIIGAKNLISKTVSKFKEIIKKERIKETIITL